LHKNGPLLILAGPGSGKTKTITHKIAYLITNGIKAENILALTFTNKAASEMKQRIFNLVKEIGGKEDVKNLTMGTFHSFGSMILRNSMNWSFKRPNFTIYDDEESLSLIKECYKMADISKEDYFPQTIQSAISKAKTELLTPADFYEHIQSHFDEIIYKIYDIYEKLLKKNNAYDFDDLIMKAVLYFKEKSEALNYWQEKFKYILVDEYQDTNYSQYILVKMLAQKYNNITVVGDEDQSIYSFRMADYRNILNFEKDFPSAKIIVLGQNYRSTKNIIEASSHIIKNNQFRAPKNLWTANETGEAIFLKEFENEKEEAMYIVWTIKNLVSDKLYKYSDCAVLYRVNAQSRSLEEAFLKEGLSYNLIGDISFYQRKEVKDIIAYLKFIANPADSLSLKRLLSVPPKGIGQQTINKIIPFSRDIIENPEKLKESFQGALWKKIEPVILMLNQLNSLRLKLALPDFIAQTILISGYADFLKKDLEKGDFRLENIQELISLARDFEEYPKEIQLEKFLEKVSLYSESDKLDLSADKVNLMTLHNAKGLEFKVVFIFGLEEGLLPHFKSFDEPYGIEEERRLCYVGITRAKEKVYLSYVRKRTIYGRSQYYLPSRFLKEIPAHLLQTEI
jgi:DNA helicase-2/ATP-dependent DNA helicase PcrA